MSHRPETQFRHHWSAGVAGACQHQHASDLCPT